MKLPSSPSSGSFFSSKEKVCSRTKTRTGRIFTFGSLLLIFLAAFGARAQTTNALSEAEVQGRALAKKILAQLDQPPAESSTNTGILEIRNAQDQLTRVSLAFKIIVTPTNWEAIYQADSTNGVETLSRIWRPDQGSELSYHSAKPFSMSGDTPLFDHPFANSDFLVGDLDLQFFGWPEQKIVKKEFARGHGCMVLESTNPNPLPNSYSRVDSWIDEEMLGIVQAKAYDAKGKLLKEFYPKDFKKVDGQWQLESMEIRNVQTGSRTRIEFDLKK